MALRKAAQGKEKGAAGFLTVIPAQSLPRTRIGAGVLGVRGEDGFRAPAWGELSRESPWPCVEPHKGMKRARPAS